MLENSTVLLRPPAWTRSAACAGQITPDEDYWHPHDDLKPSVAALQYAMGRRICADCPVRYPCALEALTGATAHGMYGGLTPTDRRKIARKHGYPQPGAAQHGSRSRYVVGCRCEDCTEAHRRWAEGRRAAGAWRDRQPVDVPPAPLDPAAEVSRVGKPSGAHPWRARGVLPTSSTTQRAS